MIRKSVQRFSKKHALGLDPGERDDDSTGSQCAVVLKRLDPLLRQLK